jgi:hypothetical protein
MVTMLLCDTLCDADDSTAAAPSAKKYTSPVGYVPAGRAAADTLSEPPPKKWQEYL